MIPGEDALEGDRTRRDLGVGGAVVSLVRGGQADDLGDRRGRDLGRQGRDRRRSDDVIIGGGGARERHAGHGQGADADVLLAEGHRQGADFDGIDRQDAGQGSRAPIGGGRRGPVIDLVGSSKPDDAGQSALGDVGRSVEGRIGQDVIRGLARRVGQHVAAHGERPSGAGIGDGEGRRGAAHDQRLGTDEAAQLAGGDDGLSGAVVGLGAQGESSRDLLGRDGGPSGRVDELVIRREETEDDIVGRARQKIGAVQGSAAVAEQARTGDELAQRGVGVRKGSDTRDESDAFAGHETGVGHARDGDQAGAVGRRARSDAAVIGLVRRGEAIDGDLTTGDGGGHGLGRRHRVIACVGPAEGDAGDRDLGRAGSEHRALAVELGGHVARIEQGGDVGHREDVAGDLTSGDQVGRHDRARGAVIGLLLDGVDRAQRLLRDVSGAGGDERVVGAVRAGERDAIERQRLAEAGVLIQEGQLSADVEPVAAKLVLDDERSAGRRQERAIVDLAGAGGGDLQDPRRNRERTRQREVRLEVAAGDEPGGRKGV